MTSEWDAVLAEIKRQVDLPGQPETLRVSSSRDVCDEFIHHLEPLGMYIPDVPINEDAVPTLVMLWNNRRALLSAALRERESAKDTERFAWAESNPDAAMRAIQNQWTTCGRGSREKFFGFRTAIDDAIASEKGERT